MKALEGFLAELDGLWRPPSTARLKLRLIGSAALMCQTQYERGTKDGDILETSDITGSTRTRLQSLEGAGSKLHTRHRIYLDIVASGLPFLRQTPRWWPLLDLNAQLRAFDVEALDVVDVVVSKLKRFHANDREDIEAMIDRGLVPHDALVRCFSEAAEAYMGDARESDLPRYVKHLHIVERDMLDVDPTPIELPHWI